MTSWTQQAFAILAAGDGEVVVPPPGVGDGYWAGAPSVVTAEDGLPGARIASVDPGRRQDRGFANVIAHSSDGVEFTTVATVTSEQFGSDSLERPALVQLANGNWRLYVSCATHDSWKHWWVEALDAASPAELPDGKRTVVLSRRCGNRLERHRWCRTGSAMFGKALWACRHSPRQW